MNERKNKEDVESGLESYPGTGSTSDAEITELARKFTNQSMNHGHQNPFEAEPGSVLDPNSSNFRPRAWTEAFIRLKSRDPEKHPKQTAGISFRDLSVYGYGNTTDYQKSVGNVWLGLIGQVRKLAGISSPRKIDILRDFEGLVRSGEMLVVLGPPGSGCSTLLKTISGEIHGIHVEQSSKLNYQGISAEDMKTQFRGEAIYNAEVDVHFPNLTVGDTLSFAAMARAPRHLPGGIDKWTYATHMRDVVMAKFGISHTVDTRVGDDFIRGVSGGERKRVSIAEAALSGAPLQCWDNSTRGLDSANAIEFCRTLRLSTDLMGAAACVAIYQAPQAAYEMFDKVIVLYEGHQIYFGSTKDGKNYFENLGFKCPDRQTDGDFLTSMTSVVERIPRPGWENRVPRTAKDFAAIWRSSSERRRLLDDITEYDRDFPVGGEHLEKFTASRRAEQSKRQRTKSPYTLDYAQQVRLCLWRGFQRLKGDPSLTLTQLFSNFIMSLVVASVFYNLENTTISFTPRGSLLYLALLLNSIASVLEMLTLYAQRGIVEKHSRYALYHPSAEAVASMLVDMPYKILNAFTFNVPIYLMTHLRREAGPALFFVLTTFLITMVMSMLFRTMAATSRTMAQAITPGSLFVTALLMFSGFIIPKDYILGWTEWFYYINPLAYAYEAITINEFSGRVFDCAEYVPNGPGYAGATGEQRVCSAVGSQAGVDFVFGNDYISSAYDFKPSHKWRNIGFLVAYVIFFCFTYLLATESITQKKSKGEVLVFRRGAISKAFVRSELDDEAAPGPSESKRERESMQDLGPAVVRQTAIFHWEDICYDVKIKTETRRILDCVDGWVKPGTLTALMGVSGAGKTTLLDVLASRANLGVITGEMFVDGQQRDASFQRKTGYVQQQDLHLETSTVREALNFSALLRQPSTYTRQEKLKYVDEVIELLDMELYADAVVGIPGEGLNVEQRKRLTIGVELAARPELLLFLDEPTSGLDSQTSWSICNLMEKLKNSGQAILCTIHQPSAMLFQRFDRLLFLAAGGKTVYFGEIGHNSSSLQDYFQRNGAPVCPTAANPAEWMLEIIGAAPGSSTDVDWHNTWRNSPEYAQMKVELATMKGLNRTQTQQDIAEGFKEFAAPFNVQLYEVTKRVFEQYWRTPSYIYSKGAMCVLAAALIGFSFFDAKNSMRGLQNQTFALFVLFSMFGQMAQQIMPNFVTNRSLYEARERPSKAFSWKAFVLSNLIVEIPWNALLSLLMFLCWYYPIGYQKNAEPTNAEAERGGLMFLFMFVYLVFTSTFAIMIVAGMEQAAEGANIANLLFSLSLTFSGVVATKDALPGFWIFMYRVSPFTYLTGGMLSSSVANTDVVCAGNEYLLTQPPVGSTCGQYLADYAINSGGYILNGNATADCQFCPLSTTNQYLDTVSVSFDNAWRDFGIMWVYIVFNVFAALGIYWLARMPKRSKIEMEKTA
ncbi:BcATRO, ABC transporter [Paraphoma chrysanthemicola]|uniref:BcATRO, ABC transporter n=1 Tax=Paraphoma chrysanthemicola TaxID=798071 RepID=A0A8K0VRT6_9PLEO|nr:BcATRO, ABC transporter [Paraphoma chrysanthemicola]